MYEAALLIRYFTHHSLDSEINHKLKGHCIKISFINKGIDSIDVPSIFQDKYVISSIPDYFQNSELPIIFRGT